MKKLLVAMFFVSASVTPSYAWFDSYGGFTCGYLDPLTSVLDSIFGPPCPPPAPVAVVEQQTIIEQPVVERVVTGPEAYQQSGRPRPAPPGVIPPVGPAYFPGFIVGPAPWQPLMPMW